MDTGNSVQFKAVRAISAHLTWESFLAFQLCFWLWALIID